MRMLFFRMACACLFTAPFPSFAQTGNDARTAAPQDSTTIRSGNDAAVPMQRAVARAIFAMFSLSVSTAETAPTYLGELPFQGQAQGTAPQTKPPASNPTPPALGDLGFPPAQTQGSAQEQARLDKRSHMLKIHQRLGLITIAPLVATLIASNGAGGRHSSASGRDIHAALGATTAGLYLTTASFAIFAPKIAGTTTRGPIRVHKALAWIHGPGMILTPILGAMAFDQRSRGEKVHGIAMAHGAVAWVTAGAFAAAVVSVSFRF